MSKKILKKIFSIYTHEISEKEEFWVKCLEFFNSDYSSTYRGLLDKEKQGENVPEFSRYRLWKRHQTVIERLPDHNGPTPQNVVKEFLCPESLVTPEQKGLIFFYTSNSGKTELTMWHRSEAKIEIRLEIYEKSSFLDPEFLSEIEKIFA